MSDSAPERGRRALLSALKLGTVNAYCEATELPLWMRRHRLKLWLHRYVIVQDGRDGECVHLWVARYRGKRRTGDVFEIFEHIATVPLLSDGPTRRSFWQPRVLRQARKRDIRTETLWHPMSRSQPVMFLVDDDGMRAHSDEPDITGRLVSAMEIPDDWSPG